MLVVMTVNAGYIIALLVGAMVGELASMYLQQRA